MLDIQNTEKQIQLVKSFQELVSTNYKGIVNANCWERTLIGDFQEIIKHLETEEQIVNVEIDDLIKLLKINNIEYELENYPSNFNSTFNVDINNIEFLFKINDKDFDKVEKIELDFYENLISNIDNDYYLFDFTETELKDILKKK